MVYIPVVSVQGSVSIELTARARCTADVTISLPDVLEKRPCPVGIGMVGRLSRHLTTSSAPGRCVLDITSASFYRP
jgi:hypothetical protein